MTILQPINKKSLGMTVGSYVKVSSSPGATDSEPEPRVVPNIEKYEKLLGDTPSPPSTVYALRPYSRSDS